MRFRAVPIASLLLVVCSCASAEPAETATPELETTNSAPTTTTTQTTTPTTATASGNTTSELTSTNTQPTGSTLETTSIETTSIVLRADGLGLVTLGDPVEVTSDLLVEVLGDAPFQKAQVLEWTSPQLAVVFNRLDPTTGEWTDTLHFTDWVYTGSGGDPEWVLKTPKGITVGSTLRDLEDAHGDDLWLCTHQNEAGEISWQWGTTTGIPASWPEYWPEHSFGLSGWFDRNPEDSDARVAGLTAGWKMPDHVCSPSDPADGGTS